MRKVLLPLIALTLLVSCKKDVLEEPKPTKSESEQLTSNKVKAHDNSLSFIINGQLVNAETFTIERIGDLLTIRGSRVINSAVQYVESLTLRIDGYRGKKGIFLIGSPDGWGNPVVSTTNASYNFTFVIHPPSREGIFIIRKVKKRKDGEVITGTFRIIFGANGFNDRVLTDGHFSLFIPNP